VELEASTSTFVEIDDEGLYRFSWQECPVAACAPCLSLRNAGLDGYEYALAFPIEIFFAEVSDP